MRSTTGAVLAILLATITAQGSENANKTGRKWVSIFNQDSSNFMITHGDEKMNAAGIREYLDGVVIVREGLSPEAIRGKAKEFPQGWIYEP
ncbi:MAG: hypothetical protein KBT68_12420 [bacterium]|nr:hypothetical protein [Candidatus Colisoma equi]